MPGTRTTLRAFAKVPIERHPPSPTLVCYTELQNQLVIVVAGMRVFHFRQLDLKLSSNLLCQGVRKRCVECLDIDLFQVLHSRFLDCLCHADILLRWGFAGVFCCVEMRAHSHPGKRHQAIQYTHGLP